MENIKMTLIQNPYISLLVKLLLLPLLPIVLIFSCLFPCISLPLVYVYRKNIINHIKQDYQKSKELTNYIIELAKQKYQSYAKNINIEKVKVEMGKIVNLIKIKFQNIKPQITQYIEKVIGKKDAQKCFDQVSNIVIKSRKFQIWVISQVKEYISLGINITLETMTIAYNKAQLIYNLSKEYAFLGRDMVASRIFRKKYMKYDNFGYALINESGTTINNLDRQFESKRFAIQLYHYVTSQFWKHKNLNGMSVLDLDLDFGIIEAINYISQQMKPKQYIVVSDNQQKVDQSNLKYNEENKNIKIEMVNLRNIDLQNQKFDIITNIEKIHKYQDLKQVYQQIPQLLTDNGHFMVCDYKRKNEWEQFEQIINDCGLKVVEKIDITLNVRQAMKLYYDKGLKEYNNCISRKLFYPSQPPQYQQISSREVLYMAYDLQKN